MAIIEYIELDMIRYNFKLLMYYNYTSHRYLLVFSHLYHKTDKVCINIGIYKIEYGVQVTVYKNALIYTLVYLIYLL